MDILLLFVIVGVVILIASMVRGKKVVRLSEEGKLIKRDGAYWEEKQIFELEAPYEAVSAAVKSTDYSDCAVNITHNYDGKMRSSSSRVTDGMLPLYTLEQLI